LDEVARLLRDRQQDPRWKEPNPWVVRVRPEK